MQALEAIKLITGNATPKVGQLVSFDAAGLTLQSFRLPEVTAPHLIADPISAISQHSVSVDALQQALSIHAPLQLLDLRTRTLFEAGTIAGAQHYPAEHILEEGLPDSSAKRRVLFCQAGGIAQILVDALQNHQISQIENLRDQISSSNLV
jgi:rhodanese-related sulfurtransferase